MRDSLKKAQANYQKKCKVYNIRINTETEKDILAWMQEGKATTRIKELIREDIQKTANRKERKIKLEDGATITEKYHDGKWPTYDYYINRRFVFGVPDPMEPEEIQNLYDIGYFNK